MKKPWRYWLLWLTTFPLDVFTILIVLLIRVMWGNRLDWNEGLWCELRPDSWPARSWYRYRENGKMFIQPESQWSKFGRWRTWGGTCLGHGGFFGPGRMSGDDADGPIELHEHVHVEQFEVSMLTTFLLGGSLYLLYRFTLLPDWLLCVGVWLMGYVLMAVSGWIVAWMRGENAYRGSAHEEAAYAIVEGYLREKDRS